MKFGVVVNRINVQPVLRGDVSMHPVLNRLTVVPSAGVAAPVVVIAGPRGLPGPTGSAGAGFVHNQASPSANWVINHNRGFYPSTEVFNSGGAEIDADVRNITINQTQIFFVAAIAGSARLT